MFPGNGANAAGGGLSLSKVIGGISKTLSVANQVIPLYQQAKPLIGNAKNAMKLLKVFNKETSNETTTTSINNDSNKNAPTRREENKPIEKANYSLANGPTFFL